MFSLTLKKKMAGLGRIFIPAALMTVMGLGVGAAPALAQTQIENTATIALDPEEGMIDTNPDNNEDTAVVNVTPGPQISFNKAADPSDSVSVGDLVTFTVTVTVADAALTEDFALTDTLGPGLEFNALVSISPEFTGCTNSEPLHCTLPEGTAPGTYTVVYTALVTEDADTQVENIITGDGGGDDDPECDADCDNIIPVDPDITYNKVADPSDQVEVGDTITYTVTVNVTHAPLTEDATLTDTLGTGLAFDAFVTPTDPFINCTGGATATCTLPSGTPQGTYTVSYTATVTDDAGDTVSNAAVVDGGGGDDPECEVDCDPDVPVIGPEVTYHKTADPSDMVEIGDTITFTVTVNVADANLTEDLLLTDTLDTGLDFDAFVMPTDPFTCVAGNPVLCTLPAGTSPGTYEVMYTATVNDSASGTVGNSVVAEGGGDDDPICDADCDPDVPVTPPQVTYEKTADWDDTQPPANANDGLVEVGQIITYTVTVNVADASLTEDLTITDTLDPSGFLAFDGFVTPTDPFTCNPPAGGVFTCTLPEGTEPGSYSFQFTAEVLAGAEGDFVNNAVVADGGGDPDPQCESECDPDVPVFPPEDPYVTYSKTSTPASVEVGDTITYTLSTTIANADTTADVTVTDTLSVGLDDALVVSFDTAPGYSVCNDGNPMTCTIPAGTSPGTYTVTYTAVVNDQAGDTVSNSVVEEGGGGGGPDCVQSCRDITPVIKPVVTYDKEADPSGEVEIGDSINYTVTVNVADADLIDPVQVTDTLGVGLDFVQFTDTGAFQSCAGNGIINCTLPADTAPGSYSFTYTVVVNDQAEGEVGNSVVATGGGGDDPTCETDCDPVNPLIDPVITYDKAADTAGPVDVGDTITYTLIVNVADASTTEMLTLTDTLGVGLTFNAFVAPTDPFACNEPVPPEGATTLTCTLPAGAEPGTYEVMYTATVNDQAVGQVENAVIAEGGGDDDPECETDCNPIIPTDDPVVTYNKTATPEEVEVGDTITFTVTTTISMAPITEDIQLTDTLGPGLDFQEIDTANTDTEYQCAAGDPLRCSIPAGTPPGTYTLTYTAVVTPDADDTVGNAVVETGGGGDDPTCEVDCDPVIPVIDPTVTYNKVADAEEVEIGDTITYTVTVNVNDASLSEELVLTDTLGTGLAFDAFTEPTAPFTCTAGNPLQCTLPVGTEPGTYEVSYTATVTEDAEDEVQNAVIADGGGGDDPICEIDCDPVVPIEPAVQYDKTADVSEAEIGDTITYTVDVIVSNASLTEDLLLTDTLGTGLAFDAFVEPTDPFSCGGTNPLECTLPAGTQPGNYSVSYTATVTDEAEGEVQNVVVAEGGGGDDPECIEDCDPVIPVVDPVVTFNKTTDTSEAAVGDIVTYTVTATVSEAALTEDLVLTDTLGEGLAFVEVTDAGAYTCNSENPLVCTLPAGTEPGSYPVSYTAQVTPEAASEVQNVVIADGGGDDDPICEEDCDPVVPVVDPEVTVNKTADPESGSEVAVGDTIAYTLDVEVAGSALTEDLVLTDTPSDGLTIVELPAGCSMLGEQIQCVLPAGTAAGSYSFTYTATVDSSAGDRVSNEVVPSGGGDEDPDCESCDTHHDVEAPDIRIVKTSNVSDVQIGDIVIYTITAENVGNRDLENGVLVDTPPAGFSYVDGTLMVDDEDDSGVLLNENPLTVGEIDIDAGDIATITYGMRVGAAVRPGTHRNEAVMENDEGEDISNEASADVVLVADPLIDESLILGKVFNDLNGNGRQDSATLTGVAARGGFFETAYVPNSTTVNGTPVADASAPLLHGLDLGSLPGLRNRLDESGRNQIVISQRLTSPDFTDDFVLTSSEGYTLRMDGGGDTRVEYDGRNGARLYAQRQVSRDGDAYRVDYVIGNRGIEETGIPGVRIASVDGLLMETDQFGRYHLVGIDGGFWERGRNFILKVDPSTLPEGTVFTTRNPLIRRITPGLPVRFDFGVRMPVQPLPAEPEKAQLEPGGEGLVIPNQARGPDDPGGPPAFPDDPEPLALPRGPAERGLADRLKMDSQGSVGPDNGDADPGTRK